MAFKSRRPAREAALRCLYEIDLAGSPPSDALASAFEEGELSPDQQAYARKIVTSICDDRAEIDNGLARLIRDFDFDRLAVVDRNVLRVAAYELLREPGIPPAVTINEAVEIAKRYSTPESGRFVNGVLAKYLLGTPKANWDPSKAPAEELEEPSPRAAPEAEEEVVSEDSEEAKTAKKFGSRTIRQS